MQLHTSGLQAASQFLKKLKIQKIDPLPHEAEYALFFKNSAISTGILNNTSELKIDLENKTFSLHDGELGQSVKLTKETANVEIQEALIKFGYQLPDVQFPQILEEEFEPYLIFAERSYRLLEKYRLSLVNKHTPVHLWGHNFDQDVVEYFEQSTEDGHNYQLSVGISPGDSFKENPYLYINAWPFALQTKDLHLPIGEWVAYSEDRYGLVVGWEDIEAYSDAKLFGTILELTQIARKNFDYL